MPYPTEGVRLFGVPSNQPHQNSLATGNWPSAKLVLLAVAEAIGSTTS